jgi:nitrite reductase/ring-hydroxylating ferredoxin subunit
MKHIVGLLILTILLISGCASPPAPGAPSSAGPNVRPGEAIAKTSDVPEGFTYDFTLDNESAILVNAGGQYMAYVNKCPHKGGHTKLEGDVIRCQLHGAEFKPQTGEVTKGPATAPLTSIPLEVRGDTIYAK